VQLLASWQRSRKGMSGSVANMIVSVRSPVGTGVPKTGQRLHNI
jgi:hypothetical protein